MSYNLPRGSVGVLEMVINSKRINSIITKIENEEYEGNIFSQSDKTVLQITKMFKFNNLYSFSMRD